MRSLRITVVTEEFPVGGRPFKGLFNYWTVRALQRLANVSVICPVAHYPRLRLLQPRSFLHPPVDYHCPYPDIPVQYAQYPSLPLISRPLNGWMCARSIERHISRQSPDIILAYWMYPSAYAAIQVGGRLGIPVIAGALGSDLRRIPDWVTYRRTRTALKKASLVLAVSEELRRKAIEIGAPAERVRTAANGCDSTVFKPGERIAARTQLSIGLEDPMVLFVGRLVAPKGVQDLIEAFSKLASSHPRLRLVCIGEGPLEAKLARQAAQLGLGDRICFLGVRQPTEIATWLTASNVLCLPSYSEGCPNVILEALACGRPVVASDVGGIPEIVDRNCSILFPARDTERLAEALAASLARDWDQDAIARCHTRSWDDVARETHQLCCEVLGRN